MRTHNRSARGKAVEEDGDDFNECEGFSEQHLKEGFDENESNGVDPSNEPEQPLDYEPKLYQHIGSSDFDTDSDELDEDTDFDRDKHLRLHYGLCMHQSFPRSRAEAQVTSWLSDKRKRLRVGPKNAAKPKISNHRLALLTQEDWIITEVDKACLQGTLFYLPGPILIFRPRNRREGDRSGLATIPEDYKIFYGSFQNSRDSDWIDVWFRVQVSSKKYSISWFTGRYAEEQTNWSEIRTKKITKQMWVLKCANCVYATFKKRDDQAAKLSANHGRQATEYSSGGISIQRDLFMILWFFILGPLYKNDEDFQVDELTEKIIEWQPIFRKLEHYRKRQAQQFPPAKETIIDAMIATSSKDSDSNLSTTAARAKRDIGLVIEKKQQAEDERIRANSELQSDKPRRPGRPKKPKLEPFDRFELAPIAGEVRPNHDIELLYEHGCNTRDFAEDEVTRVCRIVSLCAGKLVTRAVIKRIQSIHNGNWIGSSDPRVRYHLKSLTWIDYLSDLGHVKYLSRLVRTRDYAEYEAMMRFLIPTFYHKHITINGNETLRDGFDRLLARTRFVADSTASI